MNNFPIPSDRKVNITDFHRGYLLSHLKNNSNIKIKKNFSNRFQNIFENDNRIEEVKATQNYSSIKFQENNQGMRSSYAWPNNNIFSYITFAKPSADNQIEKKMESLMRNESAWRIPVIAVLCIIAFNLFVWQSNRAERIRHKIERTKQDIRKSVLLNNELRIQLAKKTSFSEVEKIARERWGLEATFDPKKKRIIYLELPNDKFNKTND